MFIHDNMKVYNKSISRIVRLVKEIGVSKLDQSQRFWSRL
jgi:hypothetical protein